MKRKKCSHKGCNNGAIKGGVCVTHGAKVERKRCSIEGCSSNARGKEGVCVTHGAKMKQCSFDGCTSNAQKGGVCYRHRAKSIITLTNPVLQSNAIPPSVPNEIDTW